MIRLAEWIVILHLIQITAWALCYAWTGAMADLQSAVYFSAVTYTTTGYGDLVLPEDWRLVGAIEALTGILMCGLSTGFFFAVMAACFNRTTTRWIRRVTTQGTTFAVGAARPPHPLRRWETGHPVVTRCRRGGRRVL